MTRQAIAAALVAIACAAAPGCGGGGGGRAPVAGGEAVFATLVIDALPATALAPGQAIDPIALTIEGVDRGDVTWTIDAGRLPPGLVLDGAGTLRGTPTSPGVYPFEVRATAGFTAGVKGLALAVDAFGLHATEGLLAGQAIEGRAFGVRAVGGTPPIRFSASGPGGFASRDGDAGEATYLPGAAGSGSSIAILATDARGQEAQLEVALARDVTAALAAEWGSTDVWHLDFDVSLGVDHHGHAVDFQAALAAVGLRHPDSLDRLGTPADRLAELCVQVEVHREVNELFLRERDGSPGPDGLAVTFAYTEPHSVYTKPARGTFILGSPNRFSVISLGCGTQGGVVGTAFVDDPTNPHHENDTSHPAHGEYGVFLNQLTPHFNAVVGNRSLPSDPIDAGDIETLRAILYDQPVSGTRAVEVERIVRGYARSIAVVTAHEIGHSLGLRHTDPSVGGSLMNAAATISPTVRPRFLPEDIATLRAVLPGPGRVFGNANPALHAPLPGGGVAVCERCNLVLPGHEPPRR